MYEDIIFDILFASVCLFIYRTSVCVRVSLDNPRYICLVGCGEHKTFDAAAVGAAVAAAIRDRPKARSVGVYIPPMAQACPCPEAPKIFIRKLQALLETLFVDLEPDNRSAAAAAAADAAAAAAVADAAVDAAAAAAAAVADAAAAAVADASVDAAAAGAADAVAVLWVLLLLLWLLLLLLLRLLFLRRETTRALEGSFAYRRRLSDLVRLGFRV